MLGRSVRNVQLNSLGDLTLALQVVWAKIPQQKIRKSTDQWAPVCVLSFQHKKGPHVTETLSHICNCRQILCLTNFCHASNKNNIIVHGQRLCSSKCDTLWCDVQTLKSLLKMLHFVFHFIICQFLQKISLVAWLLGSSIYSPGSMRQLESTQGTAVKHYLASVSVRTTLRYWKNPIYYVLLTMSATKPFPCYGYV